MSRHSSFSTCAEIKDLCTGKICDLNQGVPLNFVPIGLAFSEKRARALGCQRFSLVSGAEGLLA
jgi:hypothetical protein